MFSLNKLIAKYLRELANKFDAGTTEITESEAMDLLRVVAHEPLSKVQASLYLNVSVARFNDLITEGKVPEGRKIVGYKEKRWYKDELDACIYRNKKK